MNEELRKSESAGHDSVENQASEQLEPLIEATSGVPFATALLLQELHESRRYRDHAAEKALLKEIRATKDSIKLEELRQSWHPNTATYKEEKQKVVEALIAERNLSTANFVIFDPQLLPIFKHLRFDSPDAQQVLALFRKQNNYYWWSDEVVWNILRDYYEGYIGSHDPDNPRRELTFLRIKQFLRLMLLKNEWGNSSDLKVTEWSVSDETFQMLSEKEVEDILKAGLFFERVLGTFKSLQESSFFAGRETTVNKLLEFAKAVDDPHGLWKAIQEWGWESVHRLLDEGLLNVAAQLANGLYFREYGHTLKRKKIDELIPIFRSCSSGKLLDDIGYIFKYDEIQVLLNQRADFSKAFDIRILVRRSKVLPDQPGLIAAISKMSIDKRSAVMALSVGFTIEEVEDFAERGFDIQRLAALRKGIRENGLEGFDTLGTLTTLGAMEIDTEILLQTLASGFKPEEIAQYPFLASPLVTQMTGETADLQEY